MTNFLKLALISSAVVGAAALAAPVPTQAMPAHAGLAQHVDGATLVQSRRQRYRDYNDGYAQQGWGGGWYEHRDTVGTIGNNGSPYGYNRYTGQQFQECKIDLGYGRYESCNGAYR